MVNDKPTHCQILHHGECACWIGRLFNQSKKGQERYHRIQQEIHRAEESVAAMKEFRNLKEFAVVFQPWPEGLTVKTRLTHYTYIQLNVHLWRFIPFFSLKPRNGRSIIRCWHSIVFTWVKRVTGKCSVARARVCVGGQTLISISIADGQVLLYGIICWRTRATNQWIGCRHASDSIAQLMSTHISSQTTTTKAIQPNRQSIQ